MGYQNKKPRKKYCNLCAKGIISVDYKEIEVLERFLSQSNKIIPKRSSGACTMHQRRIANAIKRARIVALLPFVVE